MSISILKDLPVLKAEVTTFGIPLNKDVGQEVTVNFHTELDNSNVFYTDSNGLEMQKRQINYRPTWDLTIKSGGLNITANYYPINSAIAIVDETTNMQFTVMNDRSQAGSVIEKGRIELMQNRRSNVDDGRGVDEPLDEVNVNGIGITVPATYYVQYFNKSTR